MESQSRYYNHQLRSRTLRCPLSSTEALFDRWNSTRTGEILHRNLDGLKTFLGLNLANNWHVSFNRSRSHWASIYNGPVTMTRSSCSSMYVWCGWKVCWNAWVASTDQLNGTGNYFSLHFFSKLTAKIDLNNYSTWNWLLGTTYYLPEKCSGCRSSDCCTTVPGSPFWTKPPRRSTRKWNT